jgi:hypothetical protein
MRLFLRLWSNGQSSWLQNGDVLCFLWGTNWIYIFYVEESERPLWSSVNSSWLQIGDVLCFLWGTNWIYICYVEESRPPLWSSGQSSWLYNVDVLCFLWGTNWIYICYVEESRSPLWSSGQSSWPQIQSWGFNSQRYLIFWEVVGLERGPLILVSTVEELLGRQISGSGLEHREYNLRDPSWWQHGSLCPQKLLPTSPTSCGLSVDIFALGLRPRSLVFNMFWWVTLFHGVQYNALTTPGPSSFRHIVFVAG